MTQRWHLFTPVRIHHLAHLLCTAAAFKLPFFGLNKVLQIQSLHKSIIDNRKGCPANSFTVILLSWGSIEEKAVLGHKGIFLAVSRVATGKNWNVGLRGATIQVYNIFMFTTCDHSCIKSALVQMETLQSVKNQS